jgi:hypothetical protein
MDMENIQLDIINNIECIDKINIYPFLTEINFNNLLKNNFELFDFNSILFHNIFPFSLFNKNFYLITNELTNIFNIIANYDDKYKILISNDNDSLIYKKYIYVVLCSFIDDYNNCSDLNILRKDIKDIFINIVKIYITFCNHKYIYDYNDNHYNIVINFLNAFMSYKFVSIYNLNNYLINIEYFSKLIDFDSDDNDLEKIYYNNCFILYYTHVLHKNIKSFYDILLKKIGIKDIVELILLDYIMVEYENFIK